jgi:hypothetical protein
VDNVVYILCALAGLGCAVLLARAFFRTRTRLLLWSSVCFAALAINSILVVVDEIVLPVQDLRLARLGVAVMGLLLMAWALISQPVRGDADD